MRPRAAPPCAQCGHSLRDHYRTRTITPETSDWTRHCIISPCPCFATIGQSPKTRRGLA